ncbi:tetratricopeptide repeat protein [Myroides guanonis]|uniref:Tetratricopeptide repeat-containing protein n=1 Tax=Myroides guanonis TaxID=1150112 RepID=A0A1I3MHK2_9FLAO|nr:tetratricopeptide repeat protein [Myroides guanonis]SFI96402.1 hypothetical protein SAMN04487893_102155 [Myroides guanonis]
MNTNDLHNILQNPNLIKSEDAPFLEELLHDFPYFQSARALYLQSLYKQKSFKYNTELKKTAAHTADRDILFEFITSTEFVSYKPFSLVTDIKEEQIEAKESKSNKLVDSLIQAITTLEKKSPKIAVDTTEDNKEDLNENRSTEIKLESNTIIENRVNLEQRLHIGEPLEFNKKEKHSFQEWLQLHKSGPINREKDEIKDGNYEFSDPKRQKKIDLIDKFIETNPKIITTKNMPLTPINIEVSIQDNSSLMTETLAKIYLEQKKYQKAIQAYEILILKYPEKSSFFADQIIDIKALQQHNS